MIIRHDRSDRDSLVDGRHWPAFTSLLRGHGAASLIASRWLLTAGHVAQRIPGEVRLNVELAGKRYPIVRVIFHPGYDDGWMLRDENDQDENGDAVDLALVELEGPVENVQPFELYEHVDEQGQEVLLLGCGEFGDGIRGIRGSDRALRQATNCIDEVDRYWLKFCFDEPPAGTFLEGVGGHGDSGGPALIQDRQHFLLAGISSWQQVGERPLGTYGCVEHYTRISSFAEWIRSTCGPLL